MGRLKLVVRLDERASLVTLLGIGAQHCAEQGGDGHHADRDDKRRQQQDDGDDDASGHDLDRSDRSRVRATP